MQVRLVLLLLVSGLAMILARQSPDRKLYKDVIRRTENRQHQPVQQGHCLQGWEDARAVGLGCVLADMDHPNTDQTTAETICRNFGEGGRLVEIVNQEQMTFLQDYLGQVEHEWGVEDGWIWWWIGLNDREMEGEFVWPVNGPANFTNWDVEMDAPFPGKH